MKEKQTRQDQAITRNILKSSVGPQFQEMMAATDAKKAEARKTKESLENQMK
jgi:hypothetical protein